MVCVTWSREPIPPRALRRTAMIPSSPPSIITSRAAAQVPCRRALFPPLMVGRIGRPAQQRDPITRGDRIAQGDGQKECADRGRSPGGAAPSLWAAGQGRHLSVRKNGEFTCQHPILSWKYGPIQDKTRVGRWFARRVARQAPKASEISSISFPAAASAACLARSPVYFSRACRDV